jgi:hypothetical protein
MSIIAVNEIEPRTGNSISVPSGNNFQVDRVEANTLATRTSTGLLVAPGVTLRANDISGGNLSLTGAINANNVVSPTATLNELVMPAILSANGTNISSSVPYVVGSTVTHTAMVLTSSNNITIDFSNRNLFILTLSHNPVFTFSNGNSTPALIYIDPNGSNRTLTWPGGVKWSGSALTSLTAGNLYVITVARIGSTYVLASTEFV